MGTTKVTKASKVSTSSSAAVTQNEELLKIAQVETKAAMTSGDEKSRESTQTKLAAIDEKQTRLINTAMKAKQTLEKAREIANEANEATTAAKEKASHDQELAKRRQSEEEGALVKENKEKRRREKAAQDR